MKRILIAILFLTSGLAAKPALETATFASGCFWCIQPPFDQSVGVVKTVVGYTGGNGLNPTYQDYHDKGHSEGIQITYDPKKITYDQLLDIFWRNINPTDPNGQFVDRGPGYRAAIYVHNDKQRLAAEKSKAALDHSGRFDKPVVTPILRYSNFYPAEDYHQAFYKKNPGHYNSYHDNSGRDEFFKKLWKDAGKKRP
jgi:peptide methionine sulfoxide reductase msrA/msrB